MSELDRAIADVNAADAAAAKVEAEKFERVSAAAQGEFAVARVNAAAPDAEEQARQAAELAGTPMGFAANVLGLEGMYDWQVEVLTWFEDTTELRKGSLCTPNGAGKSANIVAPLALWWITVHPQGIVVITTKDGKQLDNQIWPALERHKERFPGYDFIERMVRNGKGGFIIGFTTDDPGRAEGWHKINDITGPLLMIVDEAKSVLDSIHMATDRCTYNAKLLTSSPGLTEGMFWRSNTDPRLGFLRKKVGLVECPHIPQSRIDNIIQTYGPDHWFTRSTLFAEFTDVDSDTVLVFQKHVVRSTMENPPAYVHGGRRAFLDFAAGRAENVFSYKEGNRIIQVCWKDPDPMRAVYRFIELFNEYKLQPSEIYGDAGGMGIAIIARFRQLGWPINPVNNESKAINHLRYPNLGCEMWHEAAAKIHKYIIPNDPILYEQTTSRRSDATSDGQLGMESKKKMAERGVVSPDRTDGLVGVIAADVELANTLFDENGLRKIESAARGTRSEQGALDLTSDVVSYEPNSANAWLSVFEKPVHGRSYVCVLNPARYDEPLEDHSLMVIRAGWSGGVDGAVQPTRLAAKVNRPLKLDSGPLARMVKNLSAWYGRCIVIPVVNDRGDIIDRLTELGVHMYVRENTEVLNHGVRERMRFGWESNDYTRSQWIGAIAEAVREETIQVEDIETAVQLFQLSANNAARMKDAEAFGVGLKLMDYASVFMPPPPPTPQWNSGTVEQSRSIPTSMIS